MKAAEQPDGQTSPDGSGTLIRTSDQDAPVEHLPGCPLLTGGDSARQMLQSPTHLSLGLLLAPLFAQLLIHQPTEKPEFGPVRDVTGPTLPIYLAQRTLLI